VAKNSLFNLVLRTSACESGCKDKDFYSAYPNVFLTFSIKNHTRLTICILVTLFNEHRFFKRAANIALSFYPPSIFFKKYGIFDSLTDTL
jgi:hypothetical protein